MGYLVLSRRLNDRILIGKNVEVLVADIRENQNGETIVDLAIQAPKEIKILKKETYIGDLRKEQNNGSSNRNQS